MRHLQFLGGIPDYGPHVWPQCWRRATRPVLVLMALLLLLSACGTDGEDKTSPTSDSGDMAAEAPLPEESAEPMSAESDDAYAPEMGPASDDRQASSASQGPVSVDVSTVNANRSLSTAITPAGFGRDIIYEATVILEALDVATASREAVDLITELGGFVVNQMTSTQPKPRTEITFKVLPVDFTYALEQLAEVGELIDQRISTDDVTERIVDLNSQITTTETSVNRLRTLMREAEFVESIVVIEDELLERETNLETLRGQLRTLQDRVDLATVTLVIEQSPEILPKTGISVKTWATAGDDDPCMGVQRLTVETDSDVRFCLEVENLGESALTDVEIRSEILRRNMGHFVPVQGEFDRIESGRLLVAVLDASMVEGRLAGRVATRGLDIAIKVTATPVHSDGTELQSITGESSVFVLAADDDTRPGFTESVRDGASALASTIGVVLVVIGVLTPFLPIIAAIAIGIWWLQRRRTRSPLQPTEPAEPGEPTQPTETAEPGEAAEPAQPTEG